MSPYYNGTNIIGGIDGNTVAYVVRDCRKLVVEGKCLCLNPNHQRKLSVLKSEYNCAKKNHGLRGQIQYLAILTNAQFEHLTGHKREE